MYKAESHIHFADLDHTTVEGPPQSSWANAHQDIGQRISRAIDENQAQAIRIVTRITQEPA